MLDRPEGQDLVADYGSLGLTLGRYPFALLRDQLAAMKSGQQLSELSHGIWVWAAGNVTSR